MRQFRTLLLLTGVALAAVAAAAAEVEIPVTIEKNRFQPSEIKVKAGTPFVLVVTNKDATPEEFESKELRIEKVIPAGKTLKIRVRALKPGTYPFVGEYHEATAKGRIIAE
jgi:plastocyanin